LRLFASPVSLSRCAIFSQPSGATAFALNVQVAYGKTPSQCLVHEADIAEFTPIAGQTELREGDVWRVVECKYQKAVSKSVLRELAFTSFRLSKSAAPEPHVYLAVPDPPVSRPLPEYWSEAKSEYGVGVLRVAFP
jgi:hypothetical protein